MYYVNHKQIEEKLQFLSFIVQGCEQVAKEWKEHQHDITLQLAQERVLHLAIESVTDVGSLLIDGFLMRDASSYEDIVEILQVEQVFDASLSVVLLELVKLRKPIVQEYVSWDRSTLHPLVGQLPTALPEFAEHVAQFIRKELA